jgi:hypothetical protein
MCSLPAMPSASAMQASLPLWISAPCKRSSTDTLLLIAANIVDVPEGAPPLRQAFSLMRYSSVGLMSPCLMAWNTTSAVINFIMLEGARNSSAFFSNSTLPLVASIRIAVGASPSKPPSSFLNPCTLWLAAYATPPQPIAIAATATIRQRSPRAVTNFELWESVVPMVIGNALSPAVSGRSMMCRGSCSNSWITLEQHGFWP